MFLSVRCVFLSSLQLASLSFLILRRIQRDTITHVRRSSCNVPVLLSNFNQTLIFLDTSSINTQLPNFMKMHPVEAGMFNADRRTGTTDMTMPTVAFHNFAIAPPPPRIGQQ